jgi:hypothetical protein
MTNSEALQVPAHPELEWAQWWSLGVDRPRRADIPLRNKSRRARLAAEVRCGLPRGIEFHSLAGKSYVCITDRGEGSTWLSDSHRLLYWDSGKLFFLTP